VIWQEVLQHPNRKCRWCNQIVICNTNAGGIANTKVAGDNVVPASVVEHPIVASGAL
jgi:hypothetical protein